jgi:hypothetical protein
MAQIGIFEGEARNVVLRLLGSETGGPVSGGTLLGRVYRYI